MAYDVPAPPPGFEIVDAPPQGFTEVSSGEDIPPPPAGFSEIGKEPTPTQQEPVALGSFGRGAIQLRSGLRVGAFMMGQSTPEEFAAGMAEDEANLLKYPKTQSQTELEAQIPEQGLWPLLTHPGAAMSMVGEGIPGMVATLPLAFGGAAAGGAAGSAVAPGPGTAAGAFVGTALGVGIGAGAVTYGDAFKQFFMQRGVNFADPVMSLQALQDPQLVNQAHWYAADKAGISAAFNAAGAAVGGKLAVRFFTPETKLLSMETAKGTAALGGVAAGTQAATEVAQGVASNEPIDPQQVYVDAFLAGLTNMVPMAAPGFAERAAKGVKRVKTERDITSTHELVDEKGRPVVVEQPKEPLAEEQIPQEREPFAGWDSSRLEAMKQQVKAGPESARPQEWNKHITVTDGTKSDNVVDVIPSSAYDTDAPISRGDLIRNIEEKQLVVTESEPTVRATSGEPLTDQIGPSKPIIDRTLLIQKETRDVPAEAMFEPFGEPTPIVQSTRGKLEPVARVDVSEQTDTEGRRILVVENVDKPMALPTEADWGELVTQRVGRYAAESGFDAVSWPKKSGSVDETIVPKAGSADAVAPTSELAPVKHVADQMNADRITVKTRNRQGRIVKLDAIEAKPFAKTPDSIPKGVADKNVRIADTVLQQVVRDPNLKGELAAAQLAIKALREILPKFNFSKPIQIILAKGMSTAFGDYTDMGTHHEIRIHLDEHRASVNAAKAAKRPADVAASIYTTLWHEFGHALAMDKWGSVDHSTQQLFMQRWREEMIDPLKNRQRTEGESELTRRNFAKVLQLGLPASDPNLMLPGSISPQHFHYITSFAEWFAEQVAKWSTTSQKPLTILDKFFHALNRKLTELFDFFKKKFPNLSGEAVPEIQSWLDSFVDQINPQFNVGWYAQAARSAATNKAALIAAGMQHVAATASTPSTTFMRSMFRQIFKGQTPAQARAGIALGDKFNVFYKYMLGLPQLAARNKHIEGLQRYNETVHAMHAFRQSMIDRAATTLKLWQGIGRKNGVILNNLIEEYSEMSYLSPAERAQGVKRMPTAPELQSMFQRLGVTPEVQGVFKQLVDDFSFMLDQYADNMMTTIRYTISDPVQQALAFARVQNEVARMKAVPYFPWMRFGDFTLTVRDQKLRVVHFETFASERARNLAVVEAEKVYPKGAFEILNGKLPEEVKPLLGMPPGLMDRIHDTLKLSPAQQKYLEELRFELAPGQSFKHRFQRKERTSGYSTDFLRSYANYMFHGSSHIARTKYVEPLERFISLVKAESEYMPDGTRRSEIASYMSKHLEQIIDARSDFVRLKGLIFHFALGFNPAAAALNLSQQLLGTLPFLMSKFGDVSGMASLIGAQTRWKTYYKESTYHSLASGPQADFFSRAMSQSFKDGTLSEAMAPELAAVSEDRNLLKWFGKPSEKLWWGFSKASSWMFQMSEQMNRRVTFSAALELAMKNPASKYVKETVKVNLIEYTRLRGEGWSDLEASAYLTARDAVRTTQFEYAAYARPRMFQGKAGALFIFKSFQLNTLFMLWNYPSAAVRSMLIMGFLGGLMGIPGTEDLSDILKVLAYQIFGKDFDLEREARQFVNDVSDGTVDPSILLHGIARKGYGIPAVMDMLGEFAGFGDVPIPTIDRSQNIGVGQILPAPLSPFLGPVSDPNAAIAQTAQRASGAAFSVGFNIYKTLVDPQLSWYDMKRWERMMPTALRNLSRMYRVYNEGEERSASGNPIQTFDPNDTEQMMEVLLMGLGYQPLALTSQYDRLRMIGDPQKVWKLRHNGLLRQLSNAYVMGDKEEIATVQGAIKKFNLELPKEAKGFAISRDAIMQSLKSRAKNVKILRQGGAIDKRSAPLIQVIDPLVPEVEVGRRTVH